MNVCNVVVCMTCNRLNRSCMGIAASSVVPCNRWVPKGKVVRMCCEQRPAYLAAKMTKRSYVS